MVLFCSLVRLSTDSLNENLINKGALSIIVIHISILLLYRPDDVDGCRPGVEVPKWLCPSCCPSCWHGLCAHPYCRSKPVECPSCCKDGCKLPECALPKCKPKLPAVPKLWCPSCCKRGCWHGFCARPECKHVWD